MIKRFYHTQESRPKKLDGPVTCYRDDAWLGTAYYFWYDLEDAKFWGHTSKRSTGFYEIYVCEIYFENIINTVFNETHYLFWLNQVEKVARFIIAKTSIKPTLKELNDYFKERGTWNEVDGILFQDLSTNPNRLLVRSIYTFRKSIQFAYRKRIQLAVYNSAIIHNFKFLRKGKCED